jgi:sugar phosphate isomerase/epimerase
MIVACLDVGHSSIAGREAQDCIRVLGKRLGALHIHDNDYLDDTHTLPGLSEMNWEEITRALADIGYEGDFTLETDHFFDSLCTVEETECGLKLAALIGRKMINKIESCKV